MTMLKQLTNYDTFYNKIELIRITKENDVIYKANYKNFKSEILLDKTNFKNNLELEGDEYINSFIKDLLAKDIMKQINKNFIKKVNQ